MSFDGILRPSQMTPSTGAMNPYTASNLARANQAGKPLVQKLSKDEEITALQEHQRQYQEAEDNEERGEAFSEEDAEAIRLFAKMRGLMSVSLETGKRYEFHINAQTGLIDLLEADTRHVILQLTPDELMRLSEKIQRYAGMLTDLSG